MERIDFQKHGGVVEIYAPSRTLLQCRISLVLICFALHLFFQPITLPMTVTRRTKCSPLLFFWIITFAKCLSFFPLIFSWFFFPFYSPMCSAYLARCSIIFLCALCLSFLSPTHTPFTCPRKPDQTPTDQPLGFWNLLILLILCLSCLGCRSSLRVRVELHTSDYAARIVLYIIRKDHMSHKKIFLNTILINSNIFFSLFCQYPKQYIDLVMSELHVQKIPSFPVIQPSDSLT